MRLRHQMMARSSHVTLSVQMERACRRSAGMRLRQQMMVRSSLVTVPFRMTTSTLSWRRQTQHVGVLSLPAALTVTTLAPTLTSMLMSTLMMTTTVTVTLATTWTASAALAAEQGRKAEPERRHDPRLPRYQLKRKTPRIV